ncbi:MAG: hypothetical protein J7M27_10370 [Candidatus Latescibacteria bacterium]|nr:hypothetical protein [Candidatus Latescibacterota bacterium]
MSWITNLLGGSVGTLVGQVGGIVDQFHLSGEEKQRFKLELEALLQKRDSEIEETIRTELQAKERVLIAELTQGDNYTKRARPTVVYAGLGFILLNYCIIPAIQSLTGAVVEPFKLPTEFWAGWSGIVMTWSIGRSMEKRGARNRLTSVITGSGTSRLLDEEVKG